jgi:hypothetical protein
MTLGTVFGATAGAGTILFMTSDALLMKRIGFFGIFGILDIGCIVAIQAAFGNDPLLGIGQVTLTACHQGGVIIRRVVVAIETVEGMTIYGGMGLVVKEDFAGIGLIHQADGCLRGRDRKCGIAHNGNYQEVNRHAVNDQTVLLGSHLHRSLLFLGGCTLFI